MKTRIIVDSTADLVPEIKARVYTVPLTVHFGQEEYIDGVTIDHRTFYEKLVESDVLPTTSQATPRDFIEEFEKAKQEGEAAVVITLASKFSGTYQSTVIAAAGYENIREERYTAAISRTDGMAKSGCSFHVNRNAGAVVLQACPLARRPKPTLSSNSAAIEMA